MPTMPVNEGFYVTSGFGPRWGSIHFGTDFGRNGGSGGHPVFAVKDGTVTAAGPASGFGQWVNVDHPASNGGGLTVYGHVIPEVRVGQSVREGQRIARINPDSRTNGGVAPHLHLEWHRYVWSPPGPNRLDPMTFLAGAKWPGSTTTSKENEMGTGDIISFTYLSGSALCLIIGPMIGAWLAVGGWNNDWEDAFIQIGGGILGGMAAAFVWPLVIPMLIVAGPAWYARNKRHQAEAERRNTATALREAANLYRRGSEEWHMLRKAANETMAGKN